MIHILSDTQTQQKCRQSGPPTTIKTASGLRPPRSGTASLRTSVVWRTTVSLWGWSGPGVAQPVNVLHVVNIPFSFYFCTHCLLALSMLLPGLYIHLQLIFAHVCDGCLLPTPMHLNVRERVCEWMFMNVCTMCVDACSCMCVCECVCMRVGGCKYTYVYELCVMSVCELVYIVCFKMYLRKLC